MDDQLRSAFIDAMSRVVTGVTIVTTDGPAGRFGQTVSAICSVSADPPMVLCCINGRSPICDAIRENGRFAVNVLAADQHEISDVFAGRSPHHGRFDFNVGVWLDDDNGLPLLQDGVASFGCEMDTGYPAGSHTIFVGRVLDVVSEDRSPLLYMTRSYGRPVLHGAE